MPKPVALPLLLFLAALWICAGAALAEPPPGEGLPTVATQPFDGEIASTAPVHCSPDGITLCLGSKGRFQASLFWAAPQGSVHQAQVLPLTVDAGVFWFLSGDDPDVVVKVLDGTKANGHFWIFYAGLSDFRYQLVITDTETGTVRRYTNPQGKLASFADMLAFVGARADGAQPAEEVPAPTLPDDALEAKFKFSPTSPVVGKLVTFTVTSPADTSHLAALCWNYDGTVSPGEASCQLPVGAGCHDFGNPTPRHRFLVPGPQCVVLTVSDGTATASGSAIIVVTAACQVTGTARPVAFGPKGGSGMFDVSAPTGCPWQAQASGEQKFIRFSAAGGGGSTTTINGSGSANITFTVAENATSVGRRGAITISGTEIIVTQDGNPFAPCVSGPTKLCLRDRFEVRVSGTSFGSGLVVPLPVDKSGYITFADQSNVEMMVKFFDGTPQNGHFWFYFGALTDAGYTFTVRDSMKGISKSYANRPGQLLSQVDKETF